MPPKVPSKKTTVNHSKTHPTKGNTDISVVKKQLARGWCWTLNNYTEEEVNKLKKLTTLTTVEKLIFGKEVGSENSTPHLQGYIYFKYAKSMVDVKRITSDRMHLEVAKGGYVSNVKYCTKEGEYVQKGMDKYIAEMKEEQAHIEGTHVQTCYKMTATQQDDLTEQAQTWLFEKANDPMMDEEYILDNISDSESEDEYPLWTINEDEEHLADIRCA